jgi:hypothetical protein
MTALDGLDFHISRVDRDHEVVLSVKGEVDISTAPRLLEAISAALDGEGKVVLPRGNDLHRLPRDQGVRRGVQAGTAGSRIAGGASFTPRPGPHGARTHGPGRPATDRGLKRPALSPGRDLRCARLGDRSRGHGVEGAGTRQAPRTLPGLNREARRR